MRELLLLLLLLSSISRVWLCATPETAAHQAPPSLGFSRQEHWSGLPFPSPNERAVPLKEGGSTLCRNAHSVLLYIPLPFFFIVTKKTDFQLDLRSLILFILYWGIAELQSCVSIRYAAKWSSYTYIQSLSRVWLFVTPRTVACQCPLSMGFSRQNTGVGCRTHTRVPFLFQVFFTI